MDVGKVLTVEEARPLVREFGFELHGLTKAYGGYSGVNTVPASVAPAVAASTLPC